MTGRAFPSARAVARKAIAVILTLAAVPASTRFTVAAVQRARLALPFALADAREICHAVHAGTIIAARLCQAVVHILVTKISAPTFPADALKRVKQVDARATI